MIVGGLALANTKVTDQHAFMRAMVAHRPQLAQTIDAVALHPYAPTPAAVLDQIAEFRDTLTGLGLGHVPLEITEIGWTTTETPERRRASYLRRLAEDLPEADCNVASLIPHTWLTAEQDSADREQWFGIANGDGSLKPSGAAYLGAVRAGGRRVDRDGQRLRTRMTQFQVATSRSKGTRQMTASRGQ